MLGWAMEGDMVSVTFDAQVITGQPMVRVLPMVYCEMSITAWIDPN